MVPKVGGKGMITGEIILGAKIQEVMVFVVQYRIQRGYLRKVDRPWRQAQVFVGVVRAVNFFVHIQDPFDTEVSQSKNQGWIRLQGHINSQAIEIHSCY